MINMKTIWIATGNKNKVKEFQEMFKDYEVKSMKDLEQDIEIVEDGTTFEENALIKARSLYNVLHQPVISDDSGIEVDAMGKNQALNPLAGWEKIQAMTLKTKRLWTL